MSSDEKPKLEIMENSAEATKSAEEQAYEELQEQSRRRHPSSLPALGEVEFIKKVEDEQLDY